MGLRATLARFCPKRRASGGTNTWIGQLWCKPWSDLTWPFSGKSMTQEQVIVESAFALASNLPSGTVEALAAAILTCSEESARAEISKRVAHHQHRDLALAFVDRWRNEAKEISAQPETPDKIEGEGEYNTIQALGQEVAACSAVCFWPKENRPVGDNNKVGILHAKCAVADGEWLFLSSANLTRQAFAINVELGMLVRGGTMPRRVEQQFERPIQSGQLKQV
jgi:hypothetical protein